MDRGVRSTLPQQVADRLEQRIAEGEYRKGDKIPSERELMAVFDVSRNTMREAIRSLISAGILEARPGSGTYVRTINRFSANQDMMYAGITMADVRESRYYMEIVIAHFAAERRTDDDLDKIEEAYRYMKSDELTLEERTAADLEFHMVIARACHNRIFINMYESIKSYLRDHIAKMNMTISDNPDLMDELHEKLYRAIRERSSENAQFCIRKILDM